MPHRTPDHAVVFVPARIADPAEFAAAAAPSLERVEACGYVFAGIVRTWDDAQHMINGGRAHVVIVADMGHLPRDRRPRIEAATDPVPFEPRPEQCVPSEVASQRRRRPRRIR
ncbi:hypothetical protein GA0074692_6775 [Micromonospora pallida]|uniref:Uncharacterized protein n=1 Tax=Micromonospora pallida TaxID=145854 RepID=A0A1C6TN88_9ACTN|nr:hypothetical protein [Micromonospora pallida]SCL43128.1 hypothetical protein GA0074692_6724 [Micromonospora pallida]SCL43226.1 hypothetical protein GA0074692_6775 [Micromonospora pallida]